MPYDVSDTVPIAFDVKNSSGVLTNATTVTLTITLPDGSTATPSVTNPPGTTGQYRETYVPAVIGRYAWRVVTTTPSTAYQDVFEVRELISPALLSLADAKTHLKIPAATTTYDDELREFLEATTEIIESSVGPIARRTKTARIPATGGPLILPDTQVLSLTSLTMVRDGSTPVQISDLAVNTATGVITLKNQLYSYGYFPWWVGDMDATYVVGRTYVKPNWTLAAKLIVEHLWQTKLGNLPSIQGEDRGYVVTGSGYLVPYRAMSLLEPDDVPIGFA